MANPVIDAHFARLKERHPQATLDYLRSGAALVCVPQCPVPAGWSEPEVAVRFLAPNGYATAAPDCFWVEPVLRLVGGRMPKNTELTREIPETGIRQQWFSWHVVNGHWYPNEHDLLTWLTMCMNRLQKLE